MEKMNQLFIISEIGKAHIVCHDKTLAFEYREKQRARRHIFLLQGFPPGQVKIKMLEGSLCNTDRHFKEITGILGHVVTGNFEPRLKKEEPLAGFPKLDWDEEKGHHTVPISKEDLIREIIEIAA